MKLTRRIGVKTNHADRRPCERCYLLLTMTMRCEARQLCPWCRVV